MHKNPASARLNQSAQDIIHVGPEQLQAIKTAVSIVSPTKLNALTGAILLLDCPIEIDRRHTYAFILAHHPKVGRILIDVDPDTIMAMAIGRTGFVAMELVAPNDIKTLLSKAQ